MSQSPFVRYYRALRAHLREIELQILLLLVALGGGIWVFLEVAGSVVEGEAKAIDGRLLLAMRTPGDPSDPIGPFWLEEMGRDVTALGV